MAALRRARAWPDWRWAAAALLGLALLVALGADRTAASSHCSTQSSAALIRDCETLLTAKPVLDRNNVLTTWDGATPIASWYGVTSDATNGVTALQLWSLSLNGTIPKELGNLSSLQDLSLQDNDLSGRIPRELGTLANLTTLALWGNKLSGSIPTQLGDLSSLQILWLQQNQLTGGIPTQLGSLSALSELSLHRNPKLGYATANAAAPTLGIPSQLGNLASLQRLWLDKAGLTGAIPAALGSLTNLQVLALSCNQLSGSVPNALGNVGSAVAGNDADGDPLKTVLYLQGNRQLMLRTADLPASLTTPRASPELEVVRSGRCRGDPAPPPPPPPPAPTVIGGTTCAQAIIPPEGGRVLIQRHDQPDASFELIPGRLSADGQHVALGGVIRDVTRGQTYIVVQRDADGQVVRRWVPPDSPLIYQIPWPVVISQYNVPTCVLAAIPMDAQHPAPNQLIWRYDGGDARIFGYDAALMQWRRVPDIPAFQALGFHWCNVTSVNVGFIERLAAAGAIGPDYPTTDQPARADYPDCATT